MPLWKDRTLNTRLTVTRSFCMIRKSCWRMETSGRKKLQRTCKASLCIVKSLFPLSKQRYNRSFKSIGRAVFVILKQHTQKKKRICLIASSSASSTTASATTSATTVNARMRRTFSPKSLRIDFSLLRHSLKVRTSVFFLSCI